MKLTLVIFVVLFKDALSSSAEANALPLLRKVSRNQYKSADVESRGFLSLNKPTKRPTSANIFLVTSPTGTTDSEDSSSAEGEISGPAEPEWETWPSWPYWPTETPPVTTTTTTPKPETVPYPPGGDYPQYLPFYPPVFLPIPGWTGNPPPPFIPPNYQYRPRPQRPYRPNRPYRPHRPFYPHRPPRPTTTTPAPTPPTPSPTPPTPSTPWPHPGPIDDFASSPGTPTLITNDEIKNGVDPDDGDASDDGNDDLVLVQLPPNFNVNRLGQLSEISPQVIASLMESQRKPKPSPSPIRRRPTRKPTTTVKPTPAKRVNPALNKPAADILVKLPLAQNQLSDRKKPKPSKKPKPKPSGKPSAKPQVITDTAIPEVSNAVESSTEKPSTAVESVPSPSPNRRKSGPSRKKQTIRNPLGPNNNTRKQPVKDDSDDGLVIDDSGDVAADQKPSIELQPAPKPADESEDSEQLPIPEMPAGDKETDAAAIQNDDLDSTEFLGPEEDLIVVQRKGEPLDTQLAGSAQLSPWKLLKLPQDADWQQDTEAR